MAICAMALTTSSCDFEEVNTNQFEMTEEEGTRDDFAVGGLITALEKTVFPVGHRLTIQSNQPVSDCLPPFC